MRYFLDRDDDGHWYLVEDSHRAEWEAWLEQTDGDEPPSFAQRLNGSPSNVTFTDPQ